MNKIKYLIKNGVIIKDKNNIYIDDEVIVNSGTILYPGVSLRGNTEIGNNCILDSNTIIENSKIGNNNKIGPFVHIHTDSILGDNNIIGNYVEIKKSILGNDNKMKHLTYCGDVSIKDKCNIGAGVVFSNYNYNSVEKKKTIVGDNVFIGSNCVLCAPLNIGSNSVIGAGSVITEDISDDSFAIARSKQTNKIDYFKNKVI